MFPRQFIVLAVLTALLVPAGKMTRSYLALLTSSGKDSDASSGTG